MGLTRRRREWWFFWGGFVRGFLRDILTLTCELRGITLNILRVIPVNS